MVWVTLLSIGIKPEKGLGIHELHSASKASALKLLQPACLCLGLFRVLKKSGLSEPFGKASLANTAFGLGRFISKRDRSSWTGEEWYRYPSEACLMKPWRGVCPGPWRREEKLGASTIITLTFAIGHRNIVGDNAAGEVFYGRRSEKLTSHTRDHEGN